MTIPKDTSNSWTDFTPPVKISKSHPWISRHHPSDISNSNVSSGLISTADQEVYGNPDHAIAFRIGNGGAGWTGILENLCLSFIAQHGNDFRIAWVVNHSRHSLIALLADIAQVALTYEPDIEKMAEKEGWCKRVTAPVFWDHLMLVGPHSNPARVAAGATTMQVLQSIAEHQALFHTRGDGSATHEREQKLWPAAEVDVGTASWLLVRGSTPYEALKMAEQEQAYLLTDRGTFLTAKRDDIIPSLVVYAEGEEVLLNPCSSLVNLKVSESRQQGLAVTFAEWLGGQDAQEIIREYGEGWPNGMPLFTVRTQQEFEHEERLSGKTL